MRRIAYLAITACVLVMGSGCTVCHYISEKWADCVDDFQRHHSLTYDHLYHPWMDVSRIGKPDWCECRVNRFLDCRQCALNQPYYGPRNASAGLLLERERVAAVGDVAEPSDEVFLIE